jgi:hypothetical protein
MISFITVGYRPDLLQALAASLRLGAGSIPWELIAVDGTAFDLFRGYNHAARQAKGDILAFVHEDVQFLGNPLTLAKPIECLNDPRTGFVGIAGSMLLEATGQWWGGRLSHDEAFENCRGMVIHPSIHEGGLQVNAWPEKCGLFGRVLVVDGAWMMCHRQTFDRLEGFDEKTFTGFHFYDTDISLRASLAGLTNYVLPIPLLHLSPGQRDEKWEAARQLFIRKHASVLPLRL